MKQSVWIVYLDQGGEYSTIEGVFTLKSDAERLERAFKSAKLHAWIDDKPLNDPSVTLETGDVLWMADDRWDDHDNDCTVIETLADSSWGIDDVRGDVEDGPTIGMDHSRGGSKGLFFASTFKDACETINAGRVADGLKPIIPDMAVHRFLYEAVPQ